jgi:integrase/recombinase XerD
MGPRTRNARLVAIKSFIRFIEHRVPALLEQSRRILAIPAKRTDSHLISYLSMDEMQTVLNAPDLQRHDGIRDRAMLHLCFSAGLRVSELVNLPINAIEWQPSPNVRIMGKGRRERLLHSGSRLAWICARGWRCAVRRRRRSCSLMRAGQPLTRSGFEYILNKYVQTAAERYPVLKQRHISPHSLRHSAAMMVLQATGISAKSRSGSAMQTSRRPKFTCGRTQQKSWMQ